MSEFVGCDKNPCKNNGTCLAIGKQNCVCTNGWGGKFCELRTNCTYEKSNTVHFLQKRKSFVKICPILKMDKVQSQKGDERTKISYGPKGIPFVRGLFVEPQ